jgi:hypothetical protein
MDLSSFSGKRRGGQAPIPLDPIEQAITLCTWTLMEVQFSERWRLRTSLHGAKTQNNITIPTAVKSSNITQIHVHK